MTRLKILAAALLAALVLPFGRAAQALPDLGGRKVVVVTENAYFPLQFVDPASGKPIGWEYDAVDEIGQAAELHGRIPEHALGRDDPGGVRQAVRLRHDRHHHQ